MYRVLTSSNDTLKTLNQVRASKRGPAHNAYFHHQRKLAETPDEETRLAWFDSMKKVLEELDEELKFIPGYCCIRFLDVGCCPGGFSSYILSKNEQATGTGISLPTGKGGHSLLLEEDFQSRFMLYWADLTMYQLGPNFYFDDRLQFLPFDVQTFDLVLLDGHPLRSGGRRYPQCKTDRLLISQLIIGLQAVAIGGTILMKLAAPERKITAQVMYLLDKLSLDFRSWKPVYMHATRDTFYVVAKGVGLGPERFRFAGLLLGLERLWTKLTYGEGGQGIAMNQTDLDFIVDEKTLQREYAARWQQLSQHIWFVQTASLEGWYKAGDNGL